MAELEDRIAPLHRWPSRDRRGHEPARFRRLALAVPSGWLGHQSLRHRQRQIEFLVIGEHHAKMQLAAQRAHIALQRREVEIVLPLDL